MISQKATKLNLLDFKSIPIRTFWITSISFFLCFFSWFGIVPFMPDVVKDLGLTPDQKWNSIILAVSGNAFAHLLISKYKLKTHNNQTNYLFAVIKCL